MSQTRLPGEPHRNADIVQLEQRQQTQGELQRERFVTEAEGNAGQRTGFGAPALNEPPRLGRRRLKLVKL